MMQDPRPALEEADVALLKATRALNRVDGILVRARKEYRASPAEADKMESHLGAMLQVRDAILRAHQKLSTAADPLAVCVAELLAREGQDKGTER